MNAEPQIWIHADESCLGNQFQHRSNPGGAGGLVEFWDGELWIRRDFWISEPDTTNNRMAIRSASEALGALKRSLPVTFVSDSQYLVKGMKEWLPGWKRRGWKRKAGPIENLDLWKELDRIAQGYDPSWMWVRGHAGHARNEYANLLATRAAKTQTCSEGLADSGFADWLEQERESRQRYLDYLEHLPPGEPRGR